MERGVACQSVAAELACAELLRNGVGVACEALRQAPYLRYESEDASTSSPVVPPTLPDVTRAHVISSGTSLAAWFCCRGSTVSATYYNQSAYIYIHLCFSESRALGAATYTADSTFQC
jgi:hypothetical protein